MRVLVTGAGGYIGFAVASAFRRAGHEVIGLIRSAKHKNLLAKNEIVPLLANLQEPESYLSAAEQCEVWAHCAIDYTADAAVVDKTTLESFINLAKQTKLPRTLLYTSGVWVYGNCYPSVVNEAMPTNPLQLVRWRIKNEDFILNSSCNNLRSVIIRPGCVYGGKGSLTNYWFETAKAGTLKIIGDGSNHWSMIHQDDLARAYVLAAERELSDIVLNITDETIYNIMNVAQRISDMMGISSKIQTIDMEEAKSIVGAVTEGLLVNQAVSSERAKRLLSWCPRHTNFLNQLEQYYSAWQANQS